jgi:hypothetical protein
MKERRERQHYLITSRFLMRRPTGIVRFHKNSIFIENDKNCPFEHKNKIPINIHKRVE